MNIDDDKRYRTEVRVVRHEDAVMAPVDIVLAEARRLRAEAFDRLLRTGLGRCKRTAVSLIAPMFGWNRRAVDPDMWADRQASLAGYVKALRADAEADKKDRWLGHGA